MQIYNNSLLLRVPITVILLFHSIPGMFNNGIYEFGHYYLNEKGFAPYGVAFAWTIKISHVVCAFCILFEKFVKPACILTIAILVTGIFMVHLPDGWYVVGAGRNGIEFNVLMIFVLLAIMFPAQETGKPGTNKRSQ